MFLSQVANVLMDCDRYIQCCYNNLILFASCLSQHHLTRLPVHSCCFHRIDCYCSMAFSVCNILLVIYNYSPFFMARKCISFCAKKWKLFPWDSDYTIITRERFYYNTHKEIIIPYFVSTFYNKNCLKRNIYRNTMFLKR